MNYSIITLLLMIILLNFKNNHNKKQVKNRNKDKDKDKLIIGGFGTIELSNMLILFITLTIILYFTGVYIKDGLGLDDINELFLIIMSSSISFVVSIIAVLIGAYSYNIIKVLIVIAVILYSFSTYIDISAYLSYLIGCSVEPLFGTQSIEETDMNDTNNTETQSNTPITLGYKYSYTSDEWANIQENPHTHKEMCMNLHNRSHTALKGSDSEFLGRLNLFSYSVTSWVGSVLNIFIFYMVCYALLVNENTHAISRLNNENINKDNNENINKDKDNNKN